MSDSIVIIPTYNEKENIENIIRAVGCGFLFGIHWGWGLVGMWCAFVLDENLGCQSEPGFDIFELQ